MALSAGETAALENLFKATEGRLRTFTFLDPGANLLAWSEDLRNAPWVSDPMIQKTAGITGPDGAARGTRLINGGQAAQRIVQTVAAPASSPTRRSTRPPRAAATRRRRARSRRT